MYEDTRRYRKRMKTEQLPQEEAQRFAKKKKALKMSVFVVGAAMLCFVPSIVLLSFVFHFSLAVVFQSNLFFVVLPFIRTSSCLFNSFLNPLIYCFRQKEIRKFVFSFSAVSATGLSHSLNEITIQAKRTITNNDVAVAHSQNDNSSFGSNLEVDPENSERGGWTLAIYIDITYFTENFSTITQNFTEKEELWSSRTTPKSTHGDAFLDEAKLNRSNRKKASPGVG